jgi:hypothetical protein
MQATGSDKKPGAAANGCGPGDRSSALGIGTQGRACQHLRAHDPPFGSDV